MRMKRLLSILCAAALTVGMVPGALAATPTTRLTAGGWYETIRAELTGARDEQVVDVRYTDEQGAEIQLTGEDLAYLVRDTTGGVRIDVPGVKAGTYALTVTLAGDRTFTAEGIQVAAYDRSGFAHKVHTWDAEGSTTGIQDYTEGVGAYNDDGTLKENATVLYVTDENKDAVTLTVTNDQGKEITVAGIGNILNCKGFDKNLKASGGNANTDGKLLAKMASAGRPLVVRIVGEVTQPQGVTAWGSTDNGGSTDDNGGMCIMEYGGNVTIEGVGPDAVVNGWGFTFSADGTGRTAEKNNKRDGWGENIEVRNLTFRNVPEDCVGITGAQDTKDGFKDSAEHVWVHNNSFYGPSGLPDASKDQDKSEGDGAVDFRNGEYMTLSYNYFEGYHKTSLIGGGDSDLQYHVTWHHNWWKDVKSRSPLCRQADVHVYNNLYEGQVSYCMSLRANCYVFSEYNTFLSCTNPVKLEQSSGSTIPVGACKSYMDTFTSCQGADQAVKVESRTTPVDSTCAYANFDTDEALSYIPAGAYSLQTDTDQAASEVRANSGVMQSGGLTVPGVAAARAEGTLGGEERQMSWRYAVDDTLTVAGELGADEKVLVGCYDDLGRFTGVKLLTGEALTAQLAEGAAKIKLFWLDGGQEPKCPSVIAWGETRSE